MSACTLVDIVRLEFAAYNPRKVIPDRLQLVKLSLQKLGWLLPVYATPEGEIVSGHQRVYCARELGYKQVPVCRVNVDDINALKALNIVFNRGTNDFALDVTSKDAAIKLDEYRADIEAALTLPDVPINTYPVLNSIQTAIKPLLARNRGRFITYARNVAATLNTHKIRMPVIMTADGMVVNGIGRLQMQAEKGDTQIEAVVIDEALAPFATAVLNYLSMDFDFAEKYGNVLRFNSFRRARRVRSELGRGFVFPVIGHKPSHTLKLNNPDHLKAWVKVYGRSIVDFGAGHLHETDMLRKVGIDVTPFEPYRVTGGNEIDIAASRALSRAFLEVVKSGKAFSSVVIASVLNSVPFEQDRKHIVKIASALCSPQQRTKVFAVASSVKQTGWVGLKRDFINDSDQSKITTQLDYEPGIVLGDFSRLPKVQKFHTVEEFYRLFKTAFKTVQAGIDGQNVTVIANDPLPYDGLREALEFEFNLPYPDGSTMNLVDEALDAFSTRLGIAL